MPFFSGNSYELPPTGLPLILTSKADNGRLNSVTCDSSHVMRSIFPSFLSRRDGLRPPPILFHFPQRHKEFYPANTFQISPPSTIPLDSFQSPIDVLLRGMDRCYLCFLFCY